MRIIARPEEGWCRVRGRSERISRRSAWTWLGGAALGIVAITLGCGPTDTNDTVEDASGYATSARCVECHAEQHAQWAGSDHDLAMAPASAENVLGDFDDARFDRFPISTRFFRRDDKFFVHTEGPDGAMGDFEIKYTFGVDPLQQYLVEFPGGRLQSLTIAWDVDSGRWFSLYPDERIAPDDALHWTGRFQRWNTMCADCHSTDLRRGYDLETDGYDTTWAEINVGCEACHGPANAHIAWAKAGGGSVSETSTAASMGLVVDFAANDSRYEVDTCAPCHSRRHRLTESATPGAAFLDEHVPALLRPGLYHADGQVDGEVYVYGSFVQSAMYARGVRCSDCHEPHGLQLRAEGNALCVRCHSTEPDPRFPTLTAKAYDAPTHHFHPEGSSGAECVACHMPAKNFMEIDSRRDHSLRVPRPDLASAIGTPNACNECHADQSADWAAEAVARWYGPERRQGPHFGAVFAAARAGFREVTPNLILVAGDPGLPAIVRATALELLEASGPSPPTLAAIGDAARDGDPLVRATAVAALDRVPAEQRLLIAAPLLDDPFLSVRIEAGRILAGVPGDRLDAPRRQALDRAVAEFEAAQLAVADTAAAHLNLAVLRSERGDDAGAEAEYLESLRIGPDFIPAHFNLANFYNQHQRNDEAESVLRTAIERFPDEGEFYYSLGLLLAEENRLEASAEALAGAAERLPGRARVQFNLGLALQHLGRRDEARVALEQAYAIEGGDPSIVHGLAVFYMQAREWDRAAEFARRLVGLVPPGTEGPAELLRRIEDEIAAEAARGSG